MKANATSAMPLAAQLSSLRKRIVSVRQKRSFVKMTTGVASAIALLVGVFAVEAILDDLVDLPWIARALVFVANVAGSSYLLWRDSILPFRKPLNDDTVALMIEHAMPVFRTRFIASIQLARAKGMDSHPLVKALVAQTVAAASRLDFNYVIKTAKLRRILMIAAATLLVTGALGWWMMPGTVLLVKRALLFNIALPHKTTILSVTGDKTIGYGEDFKVEVKAGGVIPKTGQILARTQSGQMREFNLDPDPDHPGQFSTVIRSPQEPFTYRVKLNDDTSTTYHVTTILRPAVVEITCVNTYPSYIHLPPVNRNPGDLSLLAGSKLKVKIKASMPIGKAALKLVGLNTEVPLRVDPKDPTLLTGEFEIPIKDLTGFSVQMVNPDGVESGEAATYRIDLVPDRPPTVKILVPTRREELATEQATMAIAFEAKDDYGIANIELHYMIDQVEQPKPIIFDLGGRVDAEVTRNFDWDLHKLPKPVVVGNVIEFWITVADSNTVTGPGIGPTEHYQIKIVTADDKRADLQNQANDITSSIGSVKEREEEATKGLQIILQKPNP